MTLLPNPIYAESTGNTFLIFDYIALFENDFDPQVIREAWKSFGIDKVDSCLVITRMKEPSPPCNSPESLCLRMYVYEPGDGFCGNGARAVANLFYSKYSHIYSSFYIVTETGYYHELKKEKDEQASNYFMVEMGASSFTDDMGHFTHPPLMEQGPLFINDVAFYFVSTSEPHLVTFQDISDDDLIKCGTIANESHIWKDKFPIGVNLNRVRVKNEAVIQVLTFERGINRLTKSCGSGSTSCVAISKKMGYLKGKKSTVEVIGGELIVEERENKIFLGGPSFVKL